MNDTLFGSKIRRKILFYIISFFSGIVIFQLVKMQLIEKDFYVEKSNENSIKEVVDYPPRGILYDRNFKLLLSNKPSFTLRILPSEYDEKHNSIIDKVLNEQPGYVKQILNENKKYSKYIPRKIMRNIDFETVVWIEENQEYLNGIDYIVELQRDYSYGINGAHLFGYIREIDSKQLQKHKEYYNIGDFIGYSGVEKAYESLLRGTKGKKYFIVDSKQKIIREYESGQKDVKFEKGFDLVLTIDKNTQQVAEELFKDKKGALVALEPSSGEILAFVSSPSYDLSNLASVTSAEDWINLSSDINKPLFNRATMSRNPPGSTIKMVAAVAALEEGIISTSDYVRCRGVFKFGNKPFKCTHVHGRMNIMSAIEKSCNVFFYNLILKLGVDRWAKYAHMFGFGKETGIDISNEVPGIIPDVNFYNEVYGVGKWTKGYWVSLGIGQGEIIATPVQLAKYTALLATMGKSKKPHCLKGFIRTNNNEFYSMDYDEINIEISPKTWEIVRTAMYKVVNGAGTATNIRSAEYKIAGKTGTVQNPHGEDHAVFVGFAPFDNPMIAVSVIVENIGFGSTHAAPIVKAVIDTYLSETNIKNYISKISN
ncbi:penicillin-binding protein 2 [Bacteroidota bacterium]